ncbi:hypothetical protein D3C85_1242370 [compost metagenome]
MNKKLIQTYVYFEDKCYFVSTIDRESSSMYGGRYAETMVWEIDPKTNERMGFLYQDEDYEGNIRTHNNVCNMIFNEGEFWNKLDEDD